MLPSAATRPPGIIDRVPAMDEKENTKVGTTSGTSTPSPFNTKWNATHSNPHDTILRSTATARGRGHTSECSVQTARDPAQE